MKFLNSQKSSTRFIIKTTEGDSKLKPFYLFDAKNSGQRLLIEKTFNLFYHYSSDFLENHQIYGSIIGNKLEIEALSSRCVNKGSAIFHIRLYEQENDQKNQNINRNKNNESINENVKENANKKRRGEIKNKIKFQSQMKRCLGDEKTAEGGQKGVGEGEAEETGIENERATRKGKESKRGKELEKGNEIENEKVKGLFRNKKTPKNKIINKKTIPNTTIKKNQYRVFKQTNNTFPIKNNHKKHHDLSLIKYKKQINYFSEFNDQMINLIFQNKSINPASLESCYNSVLINNYTKSNPNKKKTTNHRNRSGIGNNNYQSKIELNLKKYLQKGVVKFQVTRSIQNSLNKRLSEIYQTQFIELEFKKNFFTIKSINKNHPLRINAESYSINQKMFLHGSQLTKLLFINENNEKFIFDCQSTIKRDLIINIFFLFRKEHLMKNSKNLDNHNHSIKILESKNLILSPRKERTIAVLTKDKFFNSIFKYHLRKKNNNINKKSNDESINKKENGNGNGNENEIKGINEKQKDIKYENENGNENEIENNNKSNYIGYNGNDYQILLFNSIEEYMGVAEITLFLEYFTVSYKDVTLNRYYSDYSECHLKNTNNLFIRFDIDELIFINFCFQSEKEKYQFIQEFRKLKKQYLLKKKSPIINFDCILVTPNHGNLYSCIKLRETNFQISNSIEDLSCQYFIDSKILYFDKSQSKNYVKLDLGNGYGFLSILFGNPVICSEFMKDFKNLKNHYISISLDKPYFHYSSIKIKEQFTKIVYLTEKVLTIVYSNNNDDCENRQNMMNKKNNNYNKSGKRKKKNEKGLIKYYNIENSKLITTKYNQISILQANKKIIKLEFFNKEIKNHFSFILIFEKKLLNEKIINNYLIKHNLKTFQIFNICIFSNGVGSKNNNHHFNILNHKEDSNDDFQTIIIYNSKLILSRNMCNLIINNEEQINCELVNMHLKFSAISPSILEIYFQNVTNSVVDKDFNKNKKYLIKFEINSLRTLFIWKFGNFKKKNKFIHRPLGMYFPAELIQIQRPHQSQKIQQYNGPIAIKLDYQNIKVLGKNILFQINYEKLGIQLDQENDLQCKLIFLNNNKIIYILKFIDKNLTIEFLKMVYFSAMWKINVLKGNKIQLKNLVKDLKIIKNTRNNNIINQNNNIINQNNRKVNKNKIILIDAGDDDDEDLNQGIYTWKVSYLNKKHKSIGEGKLIFNTNFRIIFLKNYPKKSKLIFIDLDLIKLNYKLKQNNLFSITNTKGNIFLINICSSMFKNQFIKQYKKYIKIIINEQNLIWGRRFEQNNKLNDDIDDPNNFEKMMHNDLEFGVEDGINDSNISPIKKKSENKDTNAQKKNRIKLDLKHLKIYLFIKNVDKQIIIDRPHLLKLSLSNAPTKKKIKITYQQNNYIFEFSSNKNKNKFINNLKLIRYLSKKKRTQIIL